MKFMPHSYQQTAIKSIIELKKCGLFLDMGLGKTVITLTAIEELMFNYFDVAKVLVIAPLRVAEDTWGRELFKWDHLKHLSMSLILGTREMRLKALNTKAHIYVINRENVQWLIKNYTWDFDMVVIDELSSFKSPTAQRFRSLKKVIGKCDRVVGLTGTPTPKGLIDLWSQIYLLDSGERLGKTVTGYRDKYFVPEKRNGKVVFSYRLRGGADEEIKKRVADICFSMRAEDYLELPDLIYTNQFVKLKDRKKYDTFEKEFYFEFKRGFEVVAVSSGVLVNKLLQLANGAIYDESNRYLEVYKEKLDKLEEVIEGCLDSPVLCFYSFKHDLERIKKRFPFACELNADNIAAWNKGDIKLLLAHPASCAYGLNLQEGGHIIVWFGLPWSLELYQQANARLYRQGQTEKVYVHHLICEGTVEERVLKSLHNKRGVQDDLLVYLSEKYK